MLLLLSACGSDGLMSHCDQDGKTALMYASNKQGDETPLMPASASGSGHTEVVKLLLDKGADVNVRSTVCGEPCILHALGPKRDCFGGDAEHRWGG